MSSILELANVSKSYDAIQALSDVSLKIPPGVTGLLGPNGSGKSTLIKAILGLLRTQQGTGKVLDFQWPAEARPIRDSIGYLPEDDCYIAGLDGIECVSLMAQLSGLPSREALRRSHEMMDFCGFGEERYREVESYSTGMRQKLKFAQALVHDPPLLILDEPTTGLDPDQRVAMLRRIGSLARDHGKSIILSTHILPDVRTVCDHVVILVNGQVKVVDSLENLTRTPRPMMHVWIDGQATRFVEHVEQLGFQTVHDSIAGCWSVAGISPDQVSVLWEAAAETQTAIRGMRPATNSLEQIFMDAAGEHSIDSDLVSALPLDNRSAS